jgi:hypothetical protein
MTALGLLAGLSERGVILSASDGRLVIDAPTGVVTGEDLATVGRLKAEVLAIVMAGTEPPAPSWPPRDRRLSTWPDSWRERWGRRSNDLIDLGRDWRTAEAQAFSEVLAIRLAEGLPDHGTSAEREDAFLAPSDPIPSLAPLRRLPSPSAALLFA